jgi:hypothetical protein
MLIEIALPEWAAPVLLLTCAMYAVNCLLAAARWALARRHRSLCLDRLAAVYGFRRQRWESNASLTARIVRFMRAPPGRHNDADELQQRRL